MPPWAITGRREEEERRELWKRKENDRCKESEVKMKEGKERGVQEIKAQGWKGEYCK